MRVLIVDDHEIFREGLRAVIESRSGSFVVGEATTVREATGLLDTLAFDLVVLDLTMPGVSGISFLREMRRRKRPQPVLVLTMHAEPDVAAEALAAGAAGFALKSDSRASLLDAVDRVMRGERFIADSVPPARVQHFLTTKPAAASDAPSPLALLSAREREIFDLLMRGYDNESIATELFISIKTVETHRTRIFGKLQVHSLGELLRFGFRHRVAGPCAVDASDRETGACDDRRRSSR